MSRRARERDTSDTLAESPSGVCGRDEGAPSAPDDDRVRAGAAAAVVCWRMGASAEGWRPKERETGSPSEGGARTLSLPPAPASVASPSSLAKAAKPPVPFAATAVDDAIVEGRLRARAPSAEGAAFGTGTPCAALEYFCRKEPPKGASELRGDTAML
mmetsp:Transcript_351/g.1160  ORF Transcript_351/g.1160 Transcript_351/m.1160 type:complete len:158 (+) Transcript_351:128-601(+)